jgi:hypothetical protein
MRAGELLSYMPDGVSPTMLRQILAREGGGDDNASAVAAATRRLLDVFAQHLTRIVGDLGVAAVYGRSLYLARQRLPWLPSVPVDRLDEWLTAIQVSLQQQETRVATEAAILVLVTTIELLSSLVGVGLTSHLLSRAWLDNFPDQTTLQTIT